MSATAQPQRPIGRSVVRHHASRQHPSRAFEWVVIAVVLTAVGALGMFLFSAGSDGPRNGHAPSSALRAGAAPTALPSPSTVAPLAGDIAPPFTLLDTHNNPIALGSLHGHPVILNFWATWCTYCKTETPVLERLYQANKSRGLLVMGVDQQDPLTMVLTFEKRYGVTYPVVMDTDQSVAQLYDVPALPATFFIDSSGVVRALDEGALSSAQIQTGVKAILGPP